MRGVGLTTSWVKLCASTRVGEARRLTTQLRLHLKRSRLIMTADFIAIFKGFIYTQAISMACLGLIFPNYAVSLTSSLLATGWGGMEVASVVVDPSDQPPVVGTGEGIRSQQFDEASTRDEWAFQSWLATETLVITADAVRRCQRLLGISAKVGETDGRSSAGLSGAPA